MADSMRWLILLAAVCLRLGTSVTAAGQPALELPVVPVPIQSSRLLAMTMDEDGFIWAGSIHRALHRYDPRTGAVETIKLPYDAVVCSCICAGDKVYITGQAYPRLMIYDRLRKTFREVEYPSPKPDVWYGTEPLDGRHLFLFDRQSVGVIRWDTRDER